MRSESGRTARCYTLSEMTFAHTCRETVERGEKAVQQTLAPLAILRSRREEAELVRTLQVYLLDGGCSVTKTAERLFLHKNTVKYRMQQIQSRWAIRPISCLKFFPSILPALRSGCSAVKCCPLGQKKRPERCKERGNYLVQSGQEEEKRAWFIVQKDNKQARFSALQPITFPEQCIKISLVPAKEVRR